MPKRTPRSSRSTKPPAKQRWAFARQSEAKKKFSFCTPLIIDVNGQKQLITPGSGVVNALNPKDGRKSGAAIMIRAIPSSRARFIAHGMLFISSGYDKPVLLRHQGRMAKAMSPPRTSPGPSTKPRRTDPSMAVIGDELYFVADNGILTCADAKTGQIHYPSAAPAPSPPPCSLPTANSTSRTKRASASS
jgi:outer membrane protein assembly factor BamB